MKLGLGTVQFGMDYGVSNPGGRTPPDEVARILAEAREAGVCVVDTAPLYGGSEAALGEAGVAGFDVVTKVPAGTAAGDLEEVFTRSLERLRLPRVHGLIAHDANDLLGEGGVELWAAMRRLVDEGFVERIGASVYTPEQVDGLLERYEPGLVQAPVNLFDQRLVRSRRLHTLKRRGAEVHTRSAFLQGLLLMEPDDAPAYFEPWREALRSYHTWLAERGVTPLQAALGYVLGLQDVDAVIVGVASAEQFAEVLAAACPLPPDDFAPLAADDPALVDPSKWRLA